MQPSAASEGQPAAPAGTYSEEDLAMLKKRAKVLEELVTTERKYLEDLYTLIMFYITPLRRNFAAELAKASKESFLAHTQNARAAVRVEQTMAHTDRAEGLESDWDVETQFKSVEALFDMNTDFLADLEKHIETSPDTCIGDCLVPFSAKVIEYSSFCVRQEATQVILKDLINHNAKFRALLQQCRNVCREKLDIFDLLIKPFQRALKYPLLMKELLRSTPTNHPDAAGTAEALKGMEAAVAEINNAKSVAEKTRRIVTVSAQLLRMDDDYGKKSHSFIFEGPVKVCKGRKTKTRVCFLFSDVFVFCEEKNDRLTVCSVAPLVQMLVERIEDEMTASLGVPLNSWKVVCDTRKHGSTVRQKSTILCCNTPEEKDNWIKLIRQSIKSAIMEQNQIEHEAEREYLRKHPGENCVSFSAVPSSSSSSSSSRDEEPSTMSLLSGSSKAGAAGAAIAEAHLESHHKEKKQFRLTLSGVPAVSTSSEKVPPPKPSHPPAAKPKRIPPSRAPPAAPPPKAKPSTPAPKPPGQPSTPRVAVPPSPSGKPPVPPSPSSSSSSKSSPPRPPSSTKPPLPQSISSKPASSSPARPPTKPPGPSTPRTASGAVSSSSRVIKAPSGGAANGGSSASSSNSASTSTAGRRPVPPAPVVKRAAPPPPTAKRPAPPPPSS